METWRSSSHGSWAHSWPNAHASSENGQTSASIHGLIHRFLLCPQDEKYWTRRHKNNEAAKRSRDARRLKENQISERAAYLERENAALRQEVAEIRKELGRCRNILSKYENSLADQ